MDIDEEEVKHISKVLEGIQVALFEKDALKLRELSDNTIHRSCSHQDAESITISILSYVLSKMIEREDYERFSGWNGFVEKFNNLLNVASKSLKNGSHKDFANSLSKAREALSGISEKDKIYISDLVKKACINKGSKIYEHGISLHQTAQLLGISQWELGEYVGQKNIDPGNTGKMDTKKRAVIAMEFFKT